MNYSGVVVDQFNQLRKGEQHERTASRLRETRPLHLRQGQGLVVPVRPERCK